MKPSRHLKRLLKNESAQALVETVIVLPVVIFFILGTIQLTLMHQARLMLEYAAFNAARTGSVWNGDKGKMRRAAAISLIASRPNWPKTDGTFFNVGSIQTWTDLVVSGLKVVAENEAAAFITNGVGLVSVDILSPTVIDFDQNNKVELDFDNVSNSFEQRRLSQLKIRVKYFYQLFIPFANKVIWYTWLEMRAAWAFGTANVFINAVNSWANNNGLDSIFSQDGRGPFLAFTTPSWSGDQHGLSTLFSLISGEMDTSDYFEGISLAEWIAIQVAAKGAETYYLPLVTGHTIRMQSNLYKCALDDSCE